MSRFHEFTLAEAIEIGKRNDPGKDVPSVSRVLLAHMETLTARAVELEAQRDDYLNREWIAEKAKREAEAECARLREDVARLDWLTAHIDNGGSFDGLGFDHEDWDDSIEWSDCGKDEPTFRDLIDAARTRRG